MWYTPEYNHWRSVPAETALKNSDYSQSIIHRDYVGKLMDSNLGYLMKPTTSYETENHRARTGLMATKEICRLACNYDAILLICRVKPRLVWTDPFKQDEQGVLYGFPFTNKADPEQEVVPVSLDEGGNEIESRMETVKPRVESGEGPEELRIISEGRAVQLVISPGVITRGWTVMKSHREFATDSHLLFWRHPMIVVVLDTFDPPIKPATIENGVLLSAS
ncbi:hypothetical protein GGS24DRAFT_286936 [Hypoxylon argillaceum]|nr:hypothetical protein GGS24DRAFT_286936 [Hypoxylon argillaceum]